VGMQERYLERIRLVLRELSRRALSRVELETRFYGRVSLNIVRLT
jgi:hypothetical protein